MPFPLSVAAGGDAGPPVVFQSAPDLGRAAVLDAREGGGTVIPGLAPSAWLARAVNEGRLSRDEAVGLGAALVDSAEPGAVTEGARLLAALGERRCAALIDAALQGDLGLMLAGDPIVPGQSVEDALLRALAAVCDVDDAEIRASLLERLRHAAIADVELRVLAVHGTPEEIREFVPPLLAEGEPARAAAILGAGLLRRGPVAAALLDALETLPDGRRQALVGAVVASTPSIAAGVTRRG